MFSAVRGCARFSGCAFAFQPIQRIPRIPIRFYCNANEGSETEDVDYMATSKKELEARDEILEKNTKWVESSGGSKKRFWFGDDSTDPRENIKAEDIDSTMDPEGFTRENPRYAAYKKNFNEERYDMLESERRPASGTAKEVHGKRVVDNLRHFHRHKMLTQTGRTVSTRPEKLYPQYEPGYNPDYLPRLFDISDASEWGDSEQAESNVEAEQQYVENYHHKPSKYSKIQQYKSPYWTTQQAVDSDESDGSEFEGLNSKKKKAQSNNVKASDSEAEAESEGLNHLEGEDDEEDLSAEEERQESETGPDYTSSSTEALPEGPDEDVDFAERKSLPPLEHDTLDRDDFLHQMLIKTGRHCKVTTGGRIFSTSALVLIGNGAGVGGLGYGKGESFADALGAAIKDAKKKLFTIYRVDNSVSFQAKQKYCRARVYVWPLAKKSGTRGAYKHQTICDLFGLTDIRIKTFGRRNDHNIYKALIRCLQTSETPEMHARRRGKKVWDINKNWRVNNRARAY